MSIQPTEPDIERLRNEYAARERRLAGSDIYSPFNPGNLFARQQRQRATLNLLLQEGITSLLGKRILEIGCGSGDVLHEFLGYGVSIDHLHGTDLLLNRVIDAHERFISLPLTCSDGQSLPYASQKFDLVLQYTVFSSVLDPVIRANIARELSRVLRPDGLIIWYDFWINPSNRQTRGIRPVEIRRLFPGSRVILKRITLAPPVARRLARYSWLACYLLESSRMLNTHYLAAIHPSRDAVGRPSFSGAGSPQV